MCIRDRLCTAVALPSAAQRNADSEPERIQPPALENPGKSSGLLPLAVVIVGLALAVAPAVIPSKRAHGE